MRIAHREVEIPLGSPGHAVQTLVDVPVRYAPDQALGHEALALRGAVPDDIESREGEGVEVVVLTE